MAEEPRAEICHPQRSRRFATRSRCAVEGPR